MRANKKNVNNFITLVGYMASVFVWLLIWHIAATSINKEIFLPTPGRVFSVLWNDLLPSENFRTSITASLAHIGAGFLLGGVSGIILAVLSAFSRIIRMFLWFPIKIMKSVPVASFVILTLLWMDSDDLSIFIPAIIVLPTLYINTLTGIEQTDGRLLEMADLFKVSLLRRIIYIYIPQILPYVLSASSLAIGMAWKSGIAAEIIGLAKNSIGNELYKAKIYLLTPELFAWTIVIVALSILCEIIIKAIARLIKRT